MEFVFLRRQLLLQSNDLLRIGNWERCLSYDVGLRSTVQHCWVFYVENCGVLATEAGEAGECVCVFGDCAVDGEKGGEDEGEVGRGEMEARGVG
jgi:hypothetical protein